MKFGVSRLLTSSTILTVSSSILSVTPSSTGVVNSNVVLDNATFIGSSDGKTNMFFGIPYAQPPVSDLRFRPPVLIEPYSGTHEAIEYGPFCPQHRVDPPATFPDGVDATGAMKLMNTIFDTGATQLEDCLSLNVWTPSNAGLDASLPVVVWIHGGGFQFGSSSLYNGGVIVERSVQLREPIIVVSINYRVSGFGFLTGTEVRNAGVGNLGYRDQRLALRWIQKYISAFGGDPTKVVLWGESAGAMSIGSQMVTNGGDAEGLFRGAYIHSGPILFTGDIEAAQHFYDIVVEGTGCSSASDSLDCLRHMPFQQLKAAMDVVPSVFSYHSLALSWAARTDGVFLPDSPRNLVAHGSIARIPVVIGACEDEAPFFALSSLNLTTTEELNTYFNSFYFPNATHDELDAWLAVYSENPVEGSPYHTGQLNVLTPQFKRMAAILGDIMFESSRKVFLEQTAEKQDVWFFMNKRYKYMAGLGSSHVTDLWEMYGPSDMTDHLVHFVNYLDPNGAASHNEFESQTVLQSHEGPIHWPKYDLEAKMMLTYMDGSPRMSLMRDVERETQLKYTAEFMKKHPLL